MGTIVATLGNTGLGAVDPLPSILDIARSNDVRVHADAAYGSYFGLASALKANALWATQQMFALEPELDIVVYAARAISASEAGAKARAVFSEAADRDLHLALIELPFEFVSTAMPGLERDAETVTCLRSVLMEPEHREWTDRIVATLEASLP